MPSPTRCIPRAHPLCEHVALSSHDRHVNSRLPADGLGRVGAYHAVQKWLQSRKPSTRKQHVYLWYEKTASKLSQRGLFRAVVCTER